jgi:hypothetical protein
MNDREEYGRCLSILALFGRSSHTIHFLSALHVAQLHYWSFLLFPFLISEQSFLFSLWRLLTRSILPSRLQAWTIDSTRPIPAYGRSSLACKAKKSSFDKYLSSSRRARKRRRHRRHWLIRSKSIVWALASTTMASILLRDSH